MTSVTYLAPPGWFLLAVQESSYFNPILLWMRGKPRRRSNNARLSQRVALSQTADRGDPYECNADRVAK